MNNFFDDDILTELSSLPINQDVRLTMVGQPPLKKIFRAPTATVQENPNEPSPKNANDLPLRMTIAEVCKQARYTKSKLLRLVKAGKFPKPIDRGGDGYVWDRETIIEALNLRSVDTKEANPWERGLQ